VGQNSVGVDSDALSLFGRNVLGNLTGHSGGFLAPLLHRLARPQHPLKHLLLMSFLFETPQEFRRIYTTSPAVADEAADSSRRSRVIVERAGSRHIGDAASRPHATDANLEEHIVAALHAGLSKTQIADAVKIRPYVIENYLLSHPEMKSAWEAARTRNRREYHRGQLAETLRKHPSMSITAARRLAGSGFRWLYLHDREWLQEIFPTICKP